MADEFDRESWERRWSKVLSDPARDVSKHPPNSHVTTEAAELRPGKALDAGCGHGAEAHWLAERGWRVTGVDFSATALEHAQAVAERIGTDVSERIDWLEADLTTWEPPARAYDLVVCIFVHVPGSVEEFVRRMGSAVRPGGTLLMVGHSPVDPATGEPTAAFDQVQVSVEQATAALDPDEWKIVIGEQRPRSAGAGVDEVVRAVKLEL